MPRNSRRHMMQQLGQAALALPLMSAAATAQPSKKAPIRIGQIGIGHAHASKLSVYRSSPDYEVVGLVEPDPELRKRAATQPVYSDLQLMTQEQLLNVPGLQAVLVETRVKDLLSTAEACVAAGKHIHLDKPAGESLAHYRRVLDSAAKQQLMVQMGYMYRYSPAVIMLREFLKQGWLGDVFEVHTVMSKVVDAGSRRELAEYPGGIMFELGCHVIDLVIGVLGKPDRINAFPRSVASTNDNLIDNMLAVFEYPKATATVKSSGVEIDGGARRHLVVCGTEGTFHIQPLDAPAARVALSTPHGDFKRGYQDIAYPKFPRYVADAADMARIIRGEKASDFSYEHDLNVQTSVLLASGLVPD